MGAWGEQGAMVDSIIKSVECPVCCDVYSSCGDSGGEAASTAAKTPKILPCFHTVCLQCAKRLDKCPQCSTPVGSGALPTNFIALAVAEALSLRSGSPKGCVLCYQGEATHFCKKCSAFMCEMCQAGHGRQFLTKDHSVVTMELARAEVSRVVSIRTKMCEVHPTEERDIFCTTCEAIGCMKCMLLLQQGHDYDSLDVVFGKAEEEVKALMEEGRLSEDLLEWSLDEVANEKDKLEADTDAAEDKLTEVVSKYSSALEEHRQRLLAELLAKKAAKMKALTTDEEEMRVAVVKSRSVREFAGGAMQQDSKVHLLSLKHGIVGGLKEVVGAQQQHKGSAGLGSLSPGWSEADLVARIARLCGFPSGTNAPEEACVSLELVKEENERLKKGREEDVERWQEAERDHFMQVCCLDLLVYCMVAWDWIWRFSAMTSTFLILTLAVTYIWAHRLSVPWCPFWL